jgi:hypothetical protein
LIEPGFADLVAKLGENIGVRCFARFQVGAADWTAADWTVAQTKAAGTEEASS